MRNRYDLQDLINMELFDTIDISNPNETFYRNVIRVPGGWIFEFFHWDCEKGIPILPTITFVPIPTIKQSTEEDDDEWTPIVKVPYDSYDKALAFIETKVGDMLDVGPYECKGGEAHFKFKSGQILYFCSVFIANPEDIAKLNNDNRDDSLILFKKHKNKNILAGDIVWILCKTKDFDEIYRHDDVYVVLAEAIEFLEIAEIIHKGE